MSAAHLDEAGMTEHCDLSDASISLHNVLALTNGECVDWLYASLAECLFQCRHEEGGPANHGGGRPCLHRELRNSLCTLTDLLRRGNHVERDKLLEPSAVVSRKIDNICDNLFRSRHMLRQICNLHSSCCVDRLCALQ